MSVTECSPLAVEYSFVWYRILCACIWLSEELSDDRGRDIAKSGGRASGDCNEWVCRPRLIVLSFQCNIPAICRVSKAADAS